MKILSKFKATVINRHNLESENHRVLDSCFISLGNSSVVSTNHLNETERGNLRFYNKHNNTGSPSGIQ